jgi:NAD(P)-dependent dehydrogenase (short-subunit alcohol dehydrogenase family)
MMMTQAQSTSAVTSAEPRHGPTQETVFLVSGGGRGITAACVIAIARRYRSRFVLIGRSPYEPDAEPAWAAGHAGEAELKRAAMAYLTETGERPTPRRVQGLVNEVSARREIAATLASVEAAGGQACYVAADVTDGQGLAAAVTEGLGVLGVNDGAPLGILHGAGVLADSLVQHKRVADFERVLSVKVDGLTNLLAAVAPRHPDVLVLFSSVAGFFGNAGQADYAVANEVLNKTAHWVHAHEPGCHVLAVNWGPWDGGMVTPGLKAQLELRHIEVIPVEAGAELLADLLHPSAAPHPQLVVGRAMAPPRRDLPIKERSHRIHRTLRLTDNPFLVDHVIGGRAVLPTVCAVAWMVNACEQLYPGATFRRVDDYRALKGIVFDEEAADDYILDLTASASAPHNQGPATLGVEALIWSQTSGGLPRYHYRAHVTLGAADTTAGMGLDEGPAVGHRVGGGNGSVAKIAGATLYRDRVLFHGPSFRGIQEVLTLDERGLTMVCSLPALPVDVRGQFPVQTFNPYVVDVQLQSLLVWAHHVIGYGGLPLRIGCGVQHRPLRFDEVTMTSMTVLSSSSRHLVADVEVRDAAGELCMEVREAEITLSERLNTLFLDNRLERVPSEEAGSMVQGMGDQA